MDELMKQYYNKIKLKETKKSVVLSATEDQVTIGIGKVTRYKDDGELQFQKTLKMKTKTYMERKCGR